MEVNIMNKESSDHYKFVMEKRVEELPCERDREFPGNCTILLFPEWENWAAIWDTAVTNADITISPTSLSFEAILLCMK